MSNVYEICFYGGLILAIIFLILSIILFIVLKIPKVFGELTGRAAKKGIKEKQTGSTTEKSVSKKEQAKYYNQNTGKIKVRDAVSQETRASNMDDTTDNLSADNNSEEKKSFSPQFDPNETAVLGISDDMDNQIANAGDSEDATNLLKVNKGEAATDILGAEEDEAATEVLTSEESESATDVPKSDSDEEPTDVLRTDSDDEPTDVLRATDYDEATAVLTSKDESDEATDVLRAQDDDEPATDVLRGDMPEDGDSTTVLASKKTRQLAHKVKVIYNIVIVNTNEKI